MAEESMDMEGIEVEGAGGYVDDDIDIDDDDEADDAPLAPPPSSVAGSSAAVPLRSVPAGGARGPSATIRAPPPRAPPESAPRPGDLLLRAGTHKEREYILARFLTGKPSLSDASHVRLYRKGEGTAKGRTAGIEADRKEKVYFNSYTGKRKLERYQKTGYSTIPERVRKPYTMEITPEGVERSVPPPPPLDSSMPIEYPPEADVYVGAFDGKSGSSYALMVMNEDNKTVDVIPVGQHSWFSFRSVRKGGAATAEEAQARMAKRQKINAAQAQLISEKIELANDRRYVAHGGRSKIEDKLGLYKVGIRRSVNIKLEREKEQADEGEADFEEEFDNDDVAQVDKEDQEKEPDRREIVFDPKKHAEQIRKLIKDEQNVVSPPDSPRSESDDEPGTTARSRSPTPAGSKRPSPSRSPSPQRSTAPRPPRPPTRPGGQPGSSVPPRSAAGSRQSTPQPTPQPSRAGTPMPQRVDVAHLLPPSGEAVAESHVTAVLKALIAATPNGKVALKEFLSYFKIKNPDQRSRLFKIIKRVGKLTEEPIKSKKYFLTLAS